MEGSVGTAVCPTTRAAFTQTLRREMSRASVRAEPVEH